MIHKKCLTLVFAFIFICFRNVAFESARCINMHAMKNNENE